MSKHVPSYLISEEENDLVLDVLGLKCYSLATAVVQLLLAPPSSPDRWEKYATGVGCLVKDGLTRSYYIRIVDIKNQTIVWEQELYRQFKYKAVSVTFHTFNAHDCRAGLNFCDEEEALLFRAAIKDRIREFKRKREANRARKMARNYHAMLQQQAMPTMLQYIPSSIAGQHAIYQVAPQASLIAGMTKGKGKNKGQKKAMQMQAMNSQMNMQGMNVFTIQTGPGGARQVVQVPREGLYGTTSGIYSPVDKQMSNMAISRSTTSVQEKKKKKGGLLGFLKRKKNDVPQSSSQMSTSEPDAKKDRSGTKPPRPPPPQSPVLERPSRPPPPSSPKPPRPPPPTITASSEPPTPSSPKPPRPPPPSSPKPPRPPPPQSGVPAPPPPPPSGHEVTKPPRPPPPKTGGTVVDTGAAGAPPPPPPPPPTVCAAPPPPPPPPTVVPGEMQYGSAGDHSSQPVGGSLMDGILSGAGRLKKVDQAAQKTKSYQPGVGGALARAMDLRSKVMQDSDDDDDDDDDDWDDDDDDEWSD